MGAYRPQSRAYRFLVPKLEPATRVLRFSSAAGEGLEAGGIRLLHILSRTGTGCNWAHSIHARVVIRASNKEPWTKRHALYECMDKVQTPASTCFDEAGPAIVLPHLAPKQ